MAPKTRQHRRSPQVERTSGRAYTTEEYEGAQAEREATISRQVTRGERKSRQAEQEAETERRARVKRTTVPEPPDRPGRGGGAGGSRSSRPSSSKRKGKSKPVLRIPRIHGNPRRILIAEGVGLSLVVTAGRLGRGESPELMDYVPVWTVFLLLGFAAETGPKSARLAVAFGGLLTLAIVLRDVAPFTKVLSVASGGPGATGGPARKGPTRKIGPIHGRGPHPRGR